MLTIVLVAAGLIVAACTPADDTSEPVVIDNPRPSAPARAIGFDTTTFRVGVIVDLTGPGADEGASLLAGAEAYWSTVNAAGGIDGNFPVELVVRDAGGSSAAAGRAFEELAPDVALIALVGDTSSLNAVRELAVDAGVVTVPATRQSTWGTVPALLPLGASYAVEGFGAVAWMSRADTEPASLCVIRDRSHVGEDLLVGALLAAGAHDHIADPVAIDVSDGAAPEQTADEIEALGCRRVLLAVASNTSGPLLETMATRSLEVDVAVGSEVSLPLPNGVEAWATGRMVVAMDAPSWGDDRSGPTALRGAMDRFLPDAVPNQRIRVGFSTQLVADALLSEAIAQGSVARSDLFDLAQSLSGFDTEGLVGSPDPSAGPAGYVRSVTIHEIVPVGGDPLGLRPVEVYEPPAIESIEALFTG